MKKLILFTLILSLVLAMPSLAEADEPVRIDWSKEVEQAFVDAGFVGTQYTLHGVGCQLIIPDSYVEQTITDEDLAHELVFHYADEETGGKIQVYDSIIDGCDDLAGLGEMLKAQYPDHPYDAEVAEYIKSESQKLRTKRAPVEEDDEDDGGYLSDKCFLDAVELVIRAGKASTSLLQRKLSIGYGKAAKFIDAMEELGIVGEPNHQKPREVLITLDEWREKLGRIKL